MSDEAAEDGFELEVDLGNVDPREFQGEQKIIAPKFPKLKQPQVQPGMPRSVGHRLTVVENVYLQLQNDEPTSVKRAFTRAIKTDEQTYTRRCKVGEDWKNLDTGWNKKYSMLYITNDEKSDGATLEIAITAVDNEVFCWRIPPGESFRGTPSHPDLVYIRSQKDIAKYTVHAYPE